MHAHARMLEAGRIVHFYDSGFLFRGRVGDCAQPVDSMGRCFINLTGVVNDSDGCLARVRKAINFDSVGRCGSDVKSLQLLVRDDPPYPLNVVVVDNLPEVADIMRRLPLVNIAALKAEVARQMEPLWARHRHFRALLAQFGELAYNYGVCTWPTDAYRRPTNVKVGEHVCEEQCAGFDIEAAVQALSEACAARRRALKEVTRDLAQTAALSHDRSMCDDDTSAPHNPSDTHPQG